MNVDLRHRLVDYFALAIIGASLILCVVAVFGLGVYTSVHGIRISSRTLFRPLTVAVTAALVWFYRSDPRQQRVSILRAGMLKHAGPIAVVLAVLTFVIAMRLSGFEARAADSYGYVSQAHLWAAGNLVQHEPLSLKAPWPEPEWTFSPLGYRPGPQPGTIVPTYPPGLPIVMAGLLKLFGTFGPFLAVPLLGSVAIFGAFSLGRRVAGEECGLITAALLLTSPIFLFQLKEPMSDVPVTAFWLLTLLFVTKSTAGFLFSGGLIASAAILTRPNLAPLAGVLAVFILTCSAARFRRRVVNTILFCAGVTPGCVIVAIINNKLYGSPLSSGYGDMSFLFSLDYLGPNLFRYSQWLLESETPFILLAAAGVVVLRQRESLRVDTPNSAPELLRSSLLASFAVTLYACYAFYRPFDNWTFLRFLLPGIAIFFIFCSVGVLHFSRRLPSRFARLVFAGGLILFLVWRLELTGLQPISRYDRRFAVVAEYVRDELPENAIVFSMIHSGSIRYYAGRSTLRWDLLPTEWFERSLEFLSNNGYHPFLLIDEGERAQFAERFAGDMKWGALDRLPVATYRGSTRSDLFDLTDPNRTSSTRSIGEQESR